MGFVERVVDFVFGLFYRNKAPQLQDPQRFDKGGLRFDYPRNWKITDEDDDCFEDGAVYSVYLDTAMGGVCSFTVMVPNDGVDLATYAEGAVSGFQEAVGEAFQVGRFQPFKAEGWSVEPRRLRIADKDRDGVSLDVDTKGFGETVTSRIEIFHVDEPGYAMFVFVNAVEVEQWEPDLPGFEMLWNSVRFTPPAEHD